MRLEIYELDLAHFFPASALAWQAALKIPKKGQIFLTDINKLLMVEKGIRGGICHSIYQYAKAKNKYMKDYDKNKESSYLKYWDVNNLYGWAMPQKLHVKNFKQDEDISEFDESFIKNYNNESEEGYFIEVDFQYPENLHNLRNDSPFLPKRMKIEKVEKLVANLHDKNELCYSQKKFETSIKSWISFEKNSQSQTTY